jgi:ELWxxDGT repeat protein
LGGQIYQLTFEPFTGDYYFGNSSSYQNTKSLRYNAEGEYYCADGITCSGYLRSALNPSRDDTNVFRSEDRIWAFEFADTDWGLVLGIYGNKLQLLSLYDGAAYKGPQITGDIFDTEVSVNSSDTLDFSFTVNDRDTPLENLDVEISVTTVEPSGYGETTVSQLSFAPNGDGGYDWTGSFSMGEFDNDTVLNETILVSISDGTYTSEQEFTIFHKPSILITFADSTYGVEAWKTDGTTSGTKILNDASTEGDSTYIGSTLYKFDNNYFYTGTTDNENYEPFIASAGGQAKPLKEGISGGAYTNFMAFEGLVYFKTKSSSGDSTLWKTNGTSVGTVEVKTISNGEIAQFFNFNNGLYFFVNGNNGGEDELWKSDGTSNGTELVKGSLYYNHASISNGKLFFSGKAYNGTQIGLWVSDGTTNGTGLLKEFIQLPMHLTDVDGVLYFQNFYQDKNDDNDMITHMDLWKTDGSVPGTSLVKEDSRPHLISVDKMFVCDDSLYFLKQDELWKSDGTGAGTIKVNTLYEDLAYNQIIWHSVQVTNNTIYFNIQFYPPLGYRIYAIHPKTNSDLIEVDPTLYDKITFYKESLDNNLIYSTQDADHYYLWAHNVDDGKTLIQTTDK